MWNTIALRGQQPFLGQKNPQLRAAPRFGLTPNPTPEQVTEWLDRVESSVKMDGLIKMKAKDGPYPMPMLLRLRNPRCAEELERQVKILDQAGFERFSRIGTIQGGRATSLETLAQLTDMGFVLSTELSR